jgi:hypothetical protein
LQGLKNIDNLKFKFANLKKKKKREKIIMICMKTDEKLGPGSFYKIEKVED